MGEYQNGLIKRIADTIYPEAGRRIKEEDDFVTEAFEDMQVSFYINDSQGGKLYVRPMLKEILNASGIDMEEAAFLNYRQDVFL